MSKILILGDLHFQKASYNYATDNMLSKIFKEQIWPYVDEHGIKKIIQVGDFTNDKKYINKQTEEVINDCFIQPIVKRKLQVITICGNHDAYARNTNQVNSLQTLFRDIPEIQIVDVEVKRDGKYVYIPWGFNVKDFPAQFAFGHIEAKGFEYQKGIVSKTGSEVSDMEFFNHVYAGHFHRKNTKKNMTYVGSLIALDFGEVDTEHGFMVFDEETYKTEFIKSQFNLFEKIFYSSSMNIQIVDYKDKVVSIIVKENNDKQKYDNFIQQVYDSKPLEVKITNLEGELKNIINLDNVESVSNILGISKQYIDQMTLKEPLKKELLFSIFEKTYQEAMING